ncbi:MAG: hypothetical protein GC186_18715 [Rhodobacteraceae bacterium]|nr:hypothetical protein [Paracoccaceae bacterium]
MQYEVISPPFTLKFDRMSKAELREYFSWFMDARPNRIDILAREVRRHIGFSTWQPDASPESLGPLGKWFAQNVETRRKSLEEIAEFSSHGASLIAAPDTELTNHTFSIAIDSGMYLSEVLLERNPDLRWGQDLIRKKSIDYGQPVLVGFGRAVFNPTRMMITAAYGIARRTEDGSVLERIYEIWSTKMIQQQ